MKTDHKEGIINQMVDIAPFEVHPRLIPYIKECMDIAVQRRDEEIRDWISKNTLSNGDVDSGCLKRFLSTPSTSVEQSSEPAQPSILEEVKRLRDEIKETYFRLEKDKKVLDQYAIGLMVNSKAAMDSLTEIINKHQS